MPDSNPGPAHVIGLCLAEAMLIVASGFAALATSSTYPMGSMWLLAAGCLGAFVLAKHLRITPGRHRGASASPEGQDLNGDLPPWASGVCYALVLPAAMWVGLYVVGELGVAHPQGSPGLAVVMLAFQYGFCGPLGFLLGMFGAVWIRSAGRRQSRNGVRLK